MWETFSPFTGEPDVTDEPIHFVENTEAWVDYIEKFGIPERIRSNLIFFLNLCIFFKR